MMENTIYQRLLGRNTDEDDGADSVAGPPPGPKVTPSKAAR